MIAGAATAHGSDGRAITHRILVVEDDLLNRMFYHEAQGALGNDVAEVERFAPDLITMDIQLPNVSGLRLVRLLKRGATTRDIPILAITAFAGCGEEARCRTVGAAAYIAKPVTMERLVGAVEELLGG